jgi:hypothetical protein
MMLRTMDIFPLTVGHFTVARLAADYMNITNTLQQKSECYTVKQLQLNWPSRL